MNRQEWNTVELRDQLLECCGKIGLATLAIDGMARQSVEPRAGISALSLMMDDIVHEIKDVVGALESYEQPKAEQETVENVAA
jgi:hypothetical protein